MQQFVSAARPARTTSRSSTGKVGPGEDEFTVDHGEISVAPSEDELALEDGEVALDKEVLAFDRGEVVPGEDELTIDDGENIFAPREDTLTVNDGRLRPVRTSVRSATARKSGLIVREWH